MKVVNRGVNLTLGIEGKSCICVNCRPHSHQAIFLVSGSRLYESVASRDWSFFMHVAVGPITMVTTHRSCSAAFCHLIGLCCCLLLIVLPPRHFYILY